MGVLLRLRRVELTEARLRDDLGQRVGHDLLGEDDRALEVVGVAGHRDDVDTRIEQLPRQLANPIRPEVEHDRGVAVRVEPRAAAEHDRLQELVGDPTRVARPDRRDRVVGLLADAQEDRVERPLRPLPPLVAVHRVVAPGHRCDAVGRQRREVGDRRLGRDVPPVGERVHPRPVAHPLPLGELEQRPQVVDVRVDAAVGDEPEQVHLAGAGAGPAEEVEQHLVLEERAVLDRAVHPHEVLVEDATGADRQVADLGVAHLTVREPDGGARGVEPCRGVPPCQVVEDRRVREVDRVPRPRRGEAPAVEDHERDERLAARAHAAAALQIAAKEAGSSEAPPTRAPSTSGCASSSAAFSGFTEPP